MAKLITLNFSGDFDNGFEITLRDEGTNLSQEVAYLPSNPILPEKYQTWQKNHLKNLDTPRGMPIDEDYFDLDTCKDSYSDLQNCFKYWLQEAGGEQCRTFIREKLSSLKANDEQARIVIQTDNPKLGQLPWHEWEDYLFKDICLGRAAIAVGPKTFQSPNSITNIQPQDKVKILSIIGQSDDLNTEFDHKILNEIVSPEEAEIQLKKPQTKSELITYLNQEWHIFFFAGHSVSDDEGKVGQFYLNQDSVEIEDLKYAISNALEKGLQLMIFNSCNGVGLANQLAELHLPQSIVMRENIPDEVALSFLEAFFTAFAKQGKSLYSAMLEARLSLRDFEHQYPGIMSLPVIYQNSAAKSLSWNELVDDDPGFEFIDDDEYEDEDETKKLNEFQKDIYDTFDDLGISSLSQYQALAEQERFVLNQEIMSKMIGLGGSPDQLLERAHFNTRFPKNLLRKVTEKNQDPWNILHRKTAVYSDHSLICIEKITNPERLYARNSYSYKNVDEKTINMLLQHRPLIELGKMTIVPELVRIEDQDSKQNKTLFNVAELDTIKVDLNDPVVKSFFLKEGKMLKREGTLVFNSPNSGGLPLDQIMEIIQVAHPQAYEYFQTHLKNTISSINPEDDTQRLTHALRAVDEGILELDAKYKSAKRKSSKNIVMAAGSGALAVALYTAGIDVMSFISAAFAGSTLSSNVSFIPGSDPIPEEIRQSPFFIPWLIHHQSQST